MLENLLSKRYAGLFISRLIRTLLHCAQCNGIVAVSLDKTAIRHEARRPIYLQCKIYICIVDDSQRAEGMSTANVPEAEWAEAGGPRSPEPARR